jgi:uridine phosphorylase
MHQTRASDRQYHIACGKGDLAEYSAGSRRPGSCSKNSQVLGFSQRSFMPQRISELHRHCIKGVPISALSSGIGPACMAIVVNEASAIDVHTFIRVGSSGAIQKDVKCGDIVYFHQPQCALTAQATATLCQNTPRQPTMRF